MKTTTISTVLSRLFIKGKYVIPRCFKTCILNFTFLIMVCIPIRAHTYQIIIPMDLSLNRPVIELLINNKGPYKLLESRGPCKYTHRYQ